MSNSQSVPKHIMAKGTVLDSHAKKGTSSAFNQYPKKKVGNKFAFRTNKMTMDQNMSSRIKL